MSSDAPGAGPRRPAPPPADAELLTLEEVAYVLRCSTATVRRMIGAGKLPSVPGSATGARRLVRRTSLDAYLRAAETVEAPAAPAPPPPTLARAGWDGVSRLVTRPRRPR